MGRPDGRGTLMAAVCRTHWVANALAFQGEGAKCSETRGIVFCLVSLPKESELQRSSRGCAKVAWGNEGGSNTMLLPGCELPPVPGLGCSYHCQTLMPRRTDSAGSTVQEGSQRRVGAHVIFQQGASGPYTPPHLPHWVPASLGRPGQAAVLSTHSVHLEHMVGQDCPYFDGRGSRLGT